MLYYIILNYPKGAAPLGFGGACGQFLKIQVLIVLPDPGALNSRTGTFPGTRCRIYRGLTQFYVFVYGLTITVFLWGCWPAPRPARRPRSAPPPRLCIYIYIYKQRLFLLFSLVLLVITSYL